MTSRRPYCSVRTADVSSRSSPLRNAKRPSAAMSEKKRLPFAGYTEASHIGVPKQQNGGHVGVPNQSCRSLTLFLWLSIFVWLTKA